MSSFEMLFADDTAVIFLCVSLIVLCLVAIIWFIKD